MEFISHSAAETENFAAELAKKLIDGPRCVRADGQSCAIALFGGMGAGKTAFVKGFARGVGFKGEVTSPTFALVHEYIGGAVPIYHFDMYRINTEEALYSTGYYDYLDNSGFIITEWSENIADYLENDAIIITLEYCGEDCCRKITVEGEV